MYVIWVVHVGEKGGWAKRSWGRWNNSDAVIAGGKSSQWQFTSLYCKMKSLIFTLLPQSQLSPEVHSKRKLWYLTFVITCNS